MADQMLVLISRILVGIFMIFLQFGRSNSHITLTYPPSRKYAFDFLTSPSSPAPCGTPKGLGPVTNLRAGSVFNVTWRLGSPTHDGGYMLQILNPNGTIHTTLTKNGTNYIGADDNSQRYTERYEVNLPNVECLNCSIRLLRQALERRYYFWTCADVNIKQSYSETCSSHGKLINGTCSCDSLYSGPVCQYKDECWKDTDCNSNGRCIDRKSRAYPKMVCFCKPGWYGMSCEKESPMKDIPQTFNGYNHFEMRNDMADIFWKILKDEGEIEIIVRMNTTSWVAVGWRDADTAKSCKDYPTLPKPSELPITEYGGKQQNIRQGQNLHAMSCNDVVLGYIKDDLSYIHDYYLQDTQTPQMDTFFGGTEDLTGAIGQERSGYSFMGFRKKLQAKEMTDKSFPNKHIHVIWAHGPQIGKMNLRPEDSNYKTMMLYKPYYTSSDDDAMFHLRGRTYRGYTQINFFQPRPYGKMSTTTVASPDVGVIQSDTQLGWELTMGLLFGTLGLLVLVTIFLLCCKIDLEKNNKRMEKERQRNALRGEVNMVAMEECGVKTILNGNTDIGVESGNTSSGSNDRTTDVSEPVYMLYDNQRDGAINTNVYDEVAPTGNAKANEVIDIDTKEVEVEINCDNSSVNVVEESVGGATGVSVEGNGVDVDVLVHSSDDVDEALDEENGNASETSSASVEAIVVVEDATNSRRPSSGSGSDHSVEASPTEPIAVVVDATNSRRSSSGSGHRSEGTDNSEEDNVVAMLDECLDSDGDEDDDDNQEEVTQM